MDKWNNITEQIKMFLAKRPNAPYDVRITNRIFDLWEKDIVKTDSKLKNISTTGRKR